MDEFVAGAEDDDNSVVTIYYQLSALMRKFSSPMGKWASNSELLKDIWKVGGLEFRSVTQVLGVNLDTTWDTLFRDHIDVTDKAHEGPSTKKQFLQATPRFYDPMGLMSPVLITGKLIFQDPWCIGVGWDVLLPGDLGSRWTIGLHYCPISWTSTFPDGRGSGEWTTVRFTYFATRPRERMGLYFTFGQPTGRKR
jgi:hypothetical protein